ncbi:hypothetical protein ACSRUE_20525 [Sorangium sp. KYC3313]|uniref:hypothetical protein n=1 Tax=Sorangium sp. KYC3313 TaxID=3449740 RepID=UPI003F8A06D7
MRGVVHMVSGRLRYRTDMPGDREIPLDPGRPGNVVSEALHQFDPDGQAPFLVEFHRKTG